MNSRTIEQQLRGLPKEVQQRLERYRFDTRHFEQLAEKVKRGHAEDNLVHGRISPPEPSDVQTLPPSGPERSRLEALGRAELSRGSVALLVLAGGMATRMGGVVKALVEALPGRTFLDLRLAEMDSIAREFGRAPRLWLMTSPATEQPIRSALGTRHDGRSVAIFSQYVSLRLTPQGDLYLDGRGLPSEHAPGHGDVPDALRESGLLEPFIESGGRIVLVTNLDNLGASLDPVILGWHLEHGQAVTCEVVDKLSQDRGGIPVRVDGKPCVLEEFRIPSDFDPATVRVFSTNTFTFDARTLSRLDLPWSYFRVQKQVDGQPVIQFERLVNQVTSALSTRYLHVPRSGAGARFLPVKDPDELAARRPEIEMVARSRGWLS